MIDFRPVTLVIGAFLSAISLLMLVPMLVDLNAGHPDWSAFGVSALIVGTTGAGLTAASWGPIKQFSIRQGFLITTLSWVALTLAACLPFILTEAGLSFTDAYFEAMSGITTTGSTVIQNLDTRPPGFLLWRSILQWIGGVGVVIMGVGLLPFLSVGGMQLFRLEAYEPSEKVLPGAKDLSVAITYLYLFLTLACFLLYWGMGMTPFDAINHSMTTVSTGGYSTHDDSFGHFIDNPDIRGPIDLVASLFMIMGALPFTFFLFMIRGKFTKTTDDSQVRFFIAILLIATLILSGRLYMVFDHHTTEAFRVALFNATSVLTGTGYATVDYTQWGPFADGIFFVIMFIGGCSGSTSCGMKVFRLQIVFATLAQYGKMLAHPHRVSVARYNGRPITEEVYLSVLSFVFIYFATFATSAVLLSLFSDIDTITAISAAGTAIANVGPGLGDIVGPAGNFSSLNDGAKWILSVTMLLGRLELLTVMVLFLPSFWRN